MAFVKLHDSLFESSLMDLDVVHRWIWICLLTMADRNGVIDAHPNAIARRANVPPAAVHQALEIFCAADPESRTPAAEGRRLEPLPDRGFGWRVLNYELYRRRRDTDEEREQARLRKQRQRERQRNSPAESRPVTSVTPCHANAEAEAEAEAESPSPPPVAGVRTRACARDDGDDGEGKRRVSRAEWDAARWILVDVAGQELDEAVILDFAADVVRRSSEAGGAGEDGALSQEGVLSWLRDRGVEVPT